MVESAYDMRRHQPDIRYTLAALFCFRRRQEIIDGLVDLLSQIIHRISARADSRVEKALLHDLRTVKGKHGLLYKMAQASVEQPEGSVRDVIYPVVSEQTLHDLMREFKAQGQAYYREVHNVIRASYGGHYRRMLPHLLEALEFCSNNELHRPVVEAIEFLKDTSTNKQRYLIIDDDVKIDGIISHKWKDIVVEKSDDGTKKIARINYEICSLQSLREGLKCKEIWVNGADRYRNPDEDLPADFSLNRTQHYDALNQPMEARLFANIIKTSMTSWISNLNGSIAMNDKVKIVNKGKKRILISPLEPQIEAPNLIKLKAEIFKRWESTNLLDVFKEADMRVSFTDEESGYS